MLLTALVAVGVAVAPFAKEPTQGNGRGVILTILVVAAAGPAVAALFSIRWVVVDKSHERLNLAARLNAYLELRSLSLRVLHGLGSIVALMTYTLGAARLLPSADGNASKVSTEQMPIFGALGTAIVGAVYAVPQQALRDEARALSARLAPLNASEPDALRDQLDNREKVDQQLGLTGTLLSDMQAMLFVLGPLLASAGSALIQLLPEIST